MILHHFLTHHQMLGYVVIFLGMMFEGDITLFTAGFLTHQGYFNFGTMLTLLFCGAIVGDNMWYVFGEFMAEKKIFSRFKNFLEKSTSPFDEHLKTRTRRTVFISKLTWGLYRPIILKAAALKISFNKFIEADLVATLVWIFLVGGFGYLTSISFLAARRYLRYTELTLLLAVVTFILISYVARKISKKEL